MIEKKECYFEVAAQDGVMTVALLGEIDHHSAVSVRAEIDAKIYELHPRSLVLDLSKINFMDSSGLGLVMGRYALAEKLGADFSIINPTERALKIFELAGLGRIINVKMEGKNDKMR